MDVAENLSRIRQNIEQACKNSNRNLDEITIIGVTKYVTIERAKETIEAGITNLGENRLEGFLEKHENIQDSASWHFIGTLQSRKVKEVIGKVDAIHSLDRMSLAKEINKRAAKPVDCFVQVNVSGEETKHGFVPEDTLSFIRELEVYNNIRIAGLMTMAPHIDDEEQLRNNFRQLASLRENIQAENITYAPCEYLSMGMSNDYQIAVEEGATHIRIGSDLVGS
ncbi:MAG TPA: YggS family pyridoxal phosphate-dependent enzyme [Lentibacillus sp.]|uniref:YggS family pyridoxal phosphate-dependent enzyme n=1 Tax=Lentibacillus sp. TaxID=1925746 RepID=UPI002B4B2B4C|nr:YggS family pyridoxal phosphate-dependent enzyme [Lentibacillus sp.]HLR62197.1 YggS family pyridoxal phosphate-dependent enzyme [Lentibacillus sp.]